MLTNLDGIDLMTETSATLFNSLGLLLLTVLGGLAAFKERKQPFHRIKIVLLILAVAFIGLSIFFQKSASRHDWEYKNDLILRYQDRYEGNRMIGQRIEAATAISDYLKKGNWDVVSDGNIDSLENVLGFYDELGFYWKNGEVSDDVLYEHFYDDMRTYCQVGINYIHKVQKTDSSTDWEYVEPLFTELTRMESQRTGKNISSCIWNTNTLQENLNSEMRLERN